MLPAALHAENVGVFFESAVPQTAFAAGEVKKALEAKGHAVKLHKLTNLAAYAGKRKVVIAQLSDKKVLSAMVQAGGKVISGLKEQGLALRTSAAGGKAWWANRSQISAGSGIAEPLAVEARLFPFLSGPTSLKQVAY